MNPKIKKVIDDIERTKARIVELQALLPELERKLTDLENAEIIKLVRKANIEPKNLYSYIESLKKSGDGVISQRSLIPPVANDVQSAPDSNEHPRYTTQNNNETTSED